MDRNIKLVFMRELESRRSLRGNVDRNIMKARFDRKIRVVPYVGTWIEILLEELLPLEGLLSFPTWERG